MKTSTLLLSYKIIRPSLPFILEGLSQSLSPFFFIRFVTLRYCLVGSDTLPLLGGLIDEIVEVSRFVSWEVHTELGDVLTIDGKRSKWSDPGCRPGLVSR